MRRGLVASANEEHRPTEEEVLDERATNQQPYGYYDAKGQGQGNVTMPDAATYAKPPHATAQQPYHYVDALDHSPLHHHQPNFLSTRHPSNPYQGAPQDPYAPDHTAGRAGETYAQQAENGEEPELGKLGITPALLDWAAMKKKGFWLNKKVGAISRAGVAGAGRSGRARLRCRSAGGKSGSHMALAEGRGPSRRARRCPLLRGGR